MSRNYDNWERLVAAAIKRQQVWELFHSDSISTLSEASSFSESSSIMVGGLNSSMVPCASPGDYDVVFTKSMNEELAELIEFLREINSSVIDTGAGRNPSISCEEDTNKVTAPLIPAPPTSLEQYSTSSLLHEYLAAVDEIINLTEKLKLHPDEVKVHAPEKALEKAMTRMKAEFRSILIRKNIPLDPDRIDLLSTDEWTDFSSCCAYYDGVAPVVSDLVLIHPDAVVDLRDIADRMTRSGYEKECLQVYFSVRRGVLDECLLILGVDRFSSDEFQTWNDKMKKKWSKAVKVIARNLLLSEKFLCMQVFPDGWEVCFFEAAKDFVMHLLSFAEEAASTAIVKWSAEELFGILDIYETLSEALPYLRFLFMDIGEPGEIVCKEAKGVLDELGEAAVATLLELEKAVEWEAPTKLIPNGEIDPLVRYVMNCAYLLVDWSCTLLKNPIYHHHVEPADLIAENDYEGLNTIARKVLSLVCTLETKIEEKSRMYQNSTMQYVFFMNNMFYMVQKANSLGEFRHIVGGNWIRKRRALVRLYTISYLRASWSKALSCLNDEGLFLRSSRIAVRLNMFSNIKGRLTNFSTCFEENYRIQTGWMVPDSQLRELLRVAIMEKLIPAYRTFLARLDSHLQENGGGHIEKYIKYAPEDLENYLSDLFEGTPKKCPIALSRRILSLFILNKG